jgi:hypothetical protein
MADIVQGDHDLLVRIDEQLKGLRTDFVGERAAAFVRSQKHDSDLKEVSLRFENYLEVVNGEVDSLRTSRTQFIAIASTMQLMLSALVATLIKIFWK